MGTLTGCSFSFASSGLRWCPPSESYWRERIKLAHYYTNLPTNLCFLCNWEFSKREIWCKNTSIFKCYSTYKNDDENEDDAKITMVSLEDEHDRSGNKSDSDKIPASTSSTPPTISPIGLSYKDFKVDSFKLMELLGPEKVDPIDVKIIKERIFGYTTFWVTREEPFGDFGEGILFLGNLRGKREGVFAKLQGQLAEIMGDKYNLFMVEEPNSEGPDPRGGPRVSFGILRKDASEPMPTTLWQYVIALLLFFLTIGSSVELGIVTQINQLPPNVVKYFTDPNAIETPDMELLLPYLVSALPLAYGVLGVQLFHEVGHFLVSLPRKVKLSIPYILPNITLGSFGAITPFKSILPDRRAMVDISIAGPIAGAALSFSMFAIGLILSSSSDAPGDLVPVPSMLFQGSLLLGLISRATLGYACGITTSAFNMLPVGCLDGGRAVQGAGKGALFGCSLTTYLLLALGVVGGSLSLPWAVYVLVFQRNPEKPCLNDVTEVGTWRRTMVVVVISLLVFTLFPMPNELAEELGIGLVASF